MVKRQDGTLASSEIGEGHLSDEAERVDGGPSLSRVLTTNDIARIDRALRDAGPDDQVHLIFENSRLREIRMIHTDEVIG